MIGACGKLDKEAVAAMTHEARLALIHRYRAAGTGIMVSGLGCFAGLLGGLWGSIGPAAIGAAFGGASGLFFGSLGPFGRASEIEKIDKGITIDDSGPGCVPCV